MKLTGREKIYLYVFLIFILAISLFFAYYEKSNTTSNMDVDEECVNLCIQAKNNGTDLSNGPCLSNHLKSNPDWVCDVAHIPREPVDNNPENQCKSYGITAKHFIEVSPDCKIIRKN